MKLRAPGLQPPRLQNRTMRTTWPPFFPEMVVENKRYYNGAVSRANLPRVDLNTVCSRTEKNRWRIATTLFLYRHKIFQFNIAAWLSGARDIHSRSVFGSLSVIWPQIFPIINWLSRLDRLQSSDDFSRLHRADVSCAHKWALPLRVLWEPIFGEVDVRRWSTFPKTREDSLYLLDFGVNEISLFKDLRNVFNTWWLDCNSTGINAYQHTYTRLLGSKAKSHAFENVFLYLRSVVLWWCVKFEVSGSVCL